MPSSIGVEMQLPEMEQHGVVPPQSAEVWQAPPSLVVSHNPQQPPPSRQAVLQQATPGLPHDESEVQALLQN
jgi:hypothetical protein